MAIEQLKIDNGSLVSAKQELEIYVASLSSQLETMRAMSFEYNDAVMDKLS